MGHPRPFLFVYFRSFQTIYRIKTVDFSGIRTQIVGVEGEHADHLTTTTAHPAQMLSCCVYNVPNVLTHYLHGNILQMFDYCGDPT